MTYRPLTEHTARCIEAAEITFRDEFRDSLTAPAWDRGAMEAECAYVAQAVREWLDEGTTDCRCQG